MNNELDDKRIGLLKTKIMRAAMNSKEGHIPSAFSILDILYCLYILLPKKIEINSKGTDFFVLSKGHASLALYAILEEAQIISPTWEATFGDFSSDYGGHPDMKKVAGVTASTGSLGHGLPFAIGKLLARRALGIKSKAYCLIGDGELNEGSNWESLLLASHHNLSELILIIDSNKSGDRALNLGNLESKLVSFDFEVRSINGHSHEDILKSLSDTDIQKPLAVIAHTIKGYGVKDMENNPAWHHAIPSETQYLEFAGELS